MAEWTTQEVADFLAVDDGFVRRLRLQDRLPAKRQIGHLWVFDSTVVKKFAKTWNRHPGTYKRKPKVRPLGDDALYPNEIRDLKKLAARRKGKSGKAILKRVKTAAVARRKAAKR